jgi:hypothetical protein
VRESGIFKALARRLVKPVLRRLPDDELQDFLVTVAKNRAESSSAADGLPVPPVRLLRRFTPRNDMLRHGNRPKSGLLFLGLG